MIMTTIKKLSGGAALAILLLAMNAAVAEAVDVRRVVSPGGIEAWLVEDHSNPIISVEIAFRDGGSVTDPEGKDGLANMVSGLIDEGAGALDSKSFRREMENRSIKLSFSAGLDRFFGGVQTLTEHSDKAFELLRLSLLEPRFDEEPIERIRSQIMARLARDAEDPDVIARLALRAVLLPDHPYQRPLRGTPESVGRIIRDDLVDYVDRVFVRDRLIVGVTGNITPEQLKIVLDETFLELPASAGGVEVAEARVDTAGGVVVVERDIPQSTAVFGHEGIRRSDPDYYAAVVVNYILGGGGFASRLYDEVREKRGLAYSVYSYLSPLDHGGVVLGGVATQNGRIAESLSIIREEWQRMAEEGPSADELADAKTYLTGSFPLRLSSTGRIARMLVGIQLENLGINYLDQRNGLIESVTLEDARRVARNLFKPDALTVVVVGQPDGVESTRPAPGGKT